MKIGRNDNCICGSGKKYKKCCMRENERIPAIMMHKRQYGSEEIYLHMCFEIANSIMDELSTNNWVGSEVNLVKKLYSEIINSKNIYSFTGGAYVNYAQLIMCTEKNEDGQKVAEIYLKKALEIKPTNQFALLNLACIYHINNRYEECLEVVNNINRYLPHYDEFMSLVSDVDKNYNMYIANPDLLKYITTERANYYEKLLKLATRIEYEIKIEYIYAMHSKELGKYLTTYNLLKNRLDKCTDINGYDALFNRYYAILGEICLPYYLNKPDEALIYLDKCLENTKDNELLLRISTNTNRALCYIEINEYQKAIDILEVQIKNNPNNTDLYNLSRAYYALGKYEEALSYIEKSMYFSEDELEYYMYGKILRALDRKNEAVSFLKKSMYFLENENLNFRISNGNIKMTSRVTGDLNKKYEAIFEELVLAYLDIKDYEYAYVINSMAIEKLPYVDRFKNYNNIINSFIDIAERNKIFETKVLELENERRRVKELTEKNSKYRAWAGELLKLQNNINLDEDELNENEWLIFETNMDKIIENIRNNSTSVDSYKSLKMKFKEMYPTLNNKALESLSTGEYLFIENKENIIDFAPIIVALSKALEIQMNEVLKLNPAKTIGQIQIMIKNMGSKFKSIDSLLEKVRIIRNSAAHTGASTKKKVEQLREIIFSKEGLESIINI